MQVQDVTHHTARINSIKLHYFEAGQGAPVFLLHGFPETSFAWRKQIPMLVEHYHVIVPDLRGYGASEKPPTGYDKRTMATDIYMLMQHLRLSRIALIGHDRGAQVAIPHCGHLPSEEQPGEVNRELLTFLQGWQSV
jgi:haloacetate dehalogenase